MKKKYIKPVLETEEILERVVLTCTVTSGDSGCEAAKGQTSTS